MSLVLFQVFVNAPLPRKPICIFTLERGDGASPVSTSPKSPQRKKSAHRQNFEPIFDTPLGPTVSALAQLSPQSQQIAVTMIRQLAEREGINIPLGPAQGLQLPAEGLPLWAAKLKSERYAERSIQMYVYLVRRYLEHDPTPTKFEIQAYLARRLEEASPAIVSNERKALASFFSFLHQEGLWSVNPLNGVRHVRVTYRERLCPETNDVLKVLNGSCLRKRDTDKLKTITLLLMTTGLRVSEAVGILKNNIDYSGLELRVMGKGGKMRVVPLLRATAEALAEYAGKHSAARPTSSQETPVPGMPTSTMSRRP